ncbi:hypothetical protein LZ31DRAFT_594935 [Colletotrichum somersetense]|nr:hypothetical protein LZ31DRAFT_594935 [Colletotrichum somersetense]
MGHLNLNFLLESGAFADFHLICTNSNGVEKKFSVHKNIVFMQCVKIRDLATIAPIEKVTFDAILRFLYSGEYEAESQPATRKRGGSEQDLHDIPQPLFYSLRALKLAQQLGIFVMYEEASSSLCCSAEY